MLVIAILEFKLACLGLLMTLKGSKVLEYGDGKCTLSSRAILQQFSPFAEQYLHEAKIRKNIIKHTRNDRDKTTAASSTERYGGGAREKMTMSLSSDRGSEHLDK